MRQRAEIAPASCRRCWSSRKEQGAGGTPALPKRSHQRFAPFEKLSHYQNLHTETLALCIPDSLHVSAKRCNRKGGLGILIDRGKDE